MAEIPLTQGMVTIVDEEDLDFLNQWKWCVSREDKGEENKIYYAVRGWRQGPKQKRICLHQLLIDVPRGKEIDHKDGDGLNNRRSNLRICNHQQNICNQRKQANASSIYKGVSWHKRNEKWEAYIGIGKKKYLGNFQDEEQAALAYNQAAIINFGEFARLNIIRERAWRQHAN